MCLRTRARPTSQCYLCTVLCVFVCVGILWRNIACALCAHAQCVIYASLTFLFAISRCMCEWWTPRHGAERRARRLYVHRQYCAGMFVCVCAKACCLYGLVLSQTHTRASTSHVCVCVYIMYLHVRASPIFAVVFCGSWTRLRVVRAHGHDRDRDRRFETGIYVLWMRARLYIPARCLTVFTTPPHCHHHHHHHHRLRSAARRARGVLV